MFLGGRFRMAAYVVSHAYRHDLIERLTYVCEQVDFRFKHLFSIMSAPLSASSFQGCRCRARRMEAHGYVLSSAAQGLLSCYVGRSTPCELLQQHENTHVYASIRLRLRH